MTCSDRARLLRALSLSQRFHLYLAYVASPRAADKLLATLADELPLQRGAPVEIVRLDPYEQRASDAPLGDGALADDILIPLLLPSEERKAHGVVHVVDVSRATHTDGAVWGRLFALWNEKRNALQQLGGEVLVVLPEWLKCPFATLAPDVWSIRSGEYIIDGGGEIEALSAPGASEDPAVRLAWYRAIPPLSLFGGDLLVRPWLRDTFADPVVDRITAEPVSRGDGTSYAPALAQRALRRAEQALRHGDLDAAERGLVALMKPSGDDGHHAPARVVAAYLVTLAAQDRAEEALAVARRVTVPQQRASESLRRALAYALWCVGNLKEADAMDAQRAVLGDPVEEARSRLLRLVERGERRTAGQRVGALAVEVGASEEQARYLASAERAYLAGHFSRGAVALLTGKGASSDRSPAAELRVDMLMALVDLSRGDRRRARRALDRCADRLSGVEPRLRALHAFVLGLVHTEEGERQRASEWLWRAREPIMAWSRTGFDRRSLHRASLAVDLALACLVPAPDPAALRALVERALMLLGPAGEDCVARVLAVEARRALARRLGEGGAEEARCALDLAWALGGRGVPAWDAILAATEREAEAAA